MFSLFSGKTTVSGQECGDLPVIDNSENDLTGSPPYAEGTTVTFTCKDMFRQSGFGVYTCTSGEWTGGSISCRPIECSALDAPLHGRMIGTAYTVGSVMRFECDTGYELIGASQILCLSNSNWEPATVPTCKIKKCPETPYIPNGNTRVEVDIDGNVDVYGAVLKVECNANYLVNGPVRIQCDENGQWTQTPTCSQVMCPPYEGLDGKCVRKVDLDGMYFFLYCTNNSTFVHGGAEMAICTNGNWDDPTMRCYCDCAINADTGLVKIDNLNADGFLKHDQALVWSCKNGARKASSEELKCFDGNLVKPDGNIGTPECIAPPTQPPTTAKPSSKTTDKNITGPDDKQEGVHPGLIGAIIAVLVALAVGIAGLLIAKKKKRLCFNKNPNSNTNASETAMMKKPDTAHYTNEKADPNEKHPLGETEKVDLGRDEAEKTKLMHEQTGVEKADNATPYQNV